MRTDIDFRICEN